MVFLLGEVIAGILKEYFEILYTYGGVYLRDSFNVCFISVT